MMKKSTWAIIATSILILGCSGGTTDKPKSEATGNRDGKFEFAVNKVECGHPTAGTTGLKETAQGEFCFITLNIKNIGNKEQLFTDSNQYALDAAKNKYGTNSAASLYVNSANKPFLEEINPGNQITAIIVFDVPKGTKLVSLELHDSAFSKGVIVKI